MNEVAELERDDGRDREVLDRELDDDLRSSVAVHADGYGEGRQDNGGESPDRHVVGFDQTRDRMTQPPANLTPDAVGATVVRCLGFRACCRSRCRCAWLCSRSGSRSQLHVHPSLLPCRP